MSLLFLSLVLSAHADERADYLASIEAQLRAADVSHLDADTRAHRYRLLDELNAYWHAGEYAEKAGLSPTFVDAAGRYCAVANLVAKDGHAELVSEIVENGNHRFLEHIYELDSWAAEVGFTPAELATIQEPGWTQTSTVKSVVQRNFGQLTWCYKDRLAAVPDLEGRVEITWVIESGRVRDAKVAVNTTGDEELGTCVAGKIDRWTFPTELEGETIYPFIFKPKKPKVDDLPWLTPPEGGT